MISPTKPISSPFEYFFFTFKSPPSLPLTPTACTPSSSTSVTRDLFTLFSTISAISIVSASVFLSPFTNTGSMPTFPTHLLISLPPPCTMIGLKPTSLRSVTSWITCFLSCSSTIADPPYFTTIIFLLNLCIYGSASMSTCAFSITCSMFLSAIVPLLIC